MTGRTVIRRSDRRSRVLPAEPDRVTTLPRTRGPARRFPSAGEAANERRLRRPRGLRQVQFHRGQGDDVAEPLERSESTVAGMKILRRLDHSDGRDGLHREPSIDLVIQCQEQGPDHRLLVLGIRSGLGALLRFVEVLVIEGETDREIVRSSIQVTVREAPDRERGRCSLDLG